MVVPQAILLIILHGIVFWSVLLVFSQRLPTKHALDSALLASSLIIRLDTAWVSAIQRFIYIAITQRGNACRLVVKDPIIMQILIQNCVLRSVLVGCLLIIIRDFACLLSIARILPSGIRNILDVCLYARLLLRVSLILIRTCVFKYALLDSLLIILPWIVLNNALQVLITLNTTTPMLMVLSNRDYAFFSAQWRQSCTIDMLLLENASQFAQVLATSEIIPLYDALPNVQLSSMLKPSVKFASPTAASTINTLFSINA